MNTEAQTTWTHYERLGVAEDASAEEIRRAHRRLAMELHSDRRSGPYEKLFERLTKDLNVARDTLLDPAARSRYDAGLAAERLDAKRKGPDSAPGAGPAASPKPPPRPGSRREGGREGGREGARASRAGNARGAGHGRGAGQRRPGEHAGKREGEGRGPRQSDGAAEGTDHRYAGTNPVTAFLRAFTRVEDHPRAHLAGASAFVAAAYLFALALGWALGGALGASGVLVGVPLLGCVARGRLRRSGRPRAASLARALWVGPLILCALSLALQLVPEQAATTGALEVLVNAAFAAAGIYPVLWLLVLGRRIAGRLTRRQHA